ncbi:MAG: RNA methyltransferase [Chloroflexi bacterium]|nr:RNA methyltransferase [Chloroflexota bacterium]
MITSISNAKVKHVRSLARRRARYAARQLVVEGVRSIEEAQGAGIVPALVFYTATVAEEPRAHALLARLRAVTPEVFEVSDAVMQAMSSTETPSGILAVVPFPDLRLPAHPEFVLILDAVRDPGNVGTILRSARATGVDAVWFAPGTADPYNDKVVRAAAGALFRVPLRVAHVWPEVESALRGMPRIYLADARGEIEHSRADWSRPVALIVGGETEGASDAARRIATARV